MELLHKDLTDKILKAFYLVYKELGYGFLEKVYENALFLELTNQGLLCKKQFQIIVYYKSNVVGEYYADILVEDKLILELKAAESICQQHEYQLINYLKATNIDVGLLLNFGKNPEFRRKVFQKKRFDK